MPSEIPPKLSVLDAVKHVLFGSSLVNVELFPSAVFTLSCNFFITFVIQMSTVTAHSKNMHECRDRPKFIFREDDAHLILASLCARI
ncbi:hypothetical protein IHE45_07G078700 [Dioscorea alata]|uniref:Uncharacterized protein n=1 Tax=Dioscorea alata TaxID=55571 RepID=A0ACB7VSD4_DIOAL|nr:hypothetical protein IHE45_07G078700 [Dioscorea alata]